MKNRTLYFGDNLKILRDKFPSDDGYFDLIYLDPPFNSRQIWNILFKDEGEEDSPAQVTAFEDTWHWNRDTEAQFDELVSDPRYPQRVSDVVLGLEKLIGKNDLMAYLTMMTVRLVELHRVLKSTGSIYLHCDPTASHYLKILMDAVFDPRNFRNEIIWKRSHAHSDARQGAQHYGRVTDTLLFYSKGEDVTWNVQYTAYDQEYIDRDYRRVEEGTGRRYRIDNLQGPGGAAKGNPLYEVMGVTRYWRYTKEKMQKLIEAGRVIQTSPGSVPQYKRYLDEMPGVPLQNLWDDLPILNNRSKESLGYPTQKPEALLERIITNSSNEGDWILDPFGGCGTTAAAAERLRRKWVVIDVTTLAINLVKRRIEAMYPDKNLEMTVEGYPADLDGAKELILQDPFEFEYWCCDLVNARPAGDKAKGKMKGADRGIDGVITFIDMNGSKQEYRKLLVQVKGGHLSAPQMRDFRGTIEREKAAGGVFISLEEPTKPMKQDAIEAGTFTYSMTGQKYPVIQLFTVAQLLDGARPNIPNLVGYAKTAPVSAMEQQTTLIPNVAPVTKKKRGKK